MNVCMEKTQKIKSRVLFSVSWRQLWFLMTISQSSEEMLLQNQRWPKWRFIPVVTPVNSSNRPACFSNRLFEAVFVCGNISKRHVCGINGKNISAEYIWSVVNGGWPRLIYYPGLVLFVDSQWGRFFSFVCDGYTNIRSNKPHCFCLYLQFNDANKHLSHRCPSTFQPIRIQHFQRSRYNRGYAPVHLYFKVTKCHAKTLKQNTSANNNYFSID